MAAKEMYDYLSALVADYTATELNVKPQRVLVEHGTKNIVVHIGDDGSEERIALDSDSIFHVDLQWDVLTAADAGTIFDFFHDSTKGNGKGRTFYWVHATDGHTYTVRFNSELPRSISMPEFHGVTSIQFKVLGYKT